MGDKSELISEVLHLNSVLVVSMDFLSIRVEVNRTLVLSSLTLFVGLGSVVSIGSPIFTHLVVVPVVSRASSSGSASSKG